MAGTQCSGDDNGDRLVSEGAVRARVALLRRSRPRGMHAAPQGALARAAYIANSVLCSVISYVK